MKYTIAFILAVSLLGWRIVSLVPGERDPYYLKFTRGKSNGLIIGSSRAGQGIIPSRLGPGIYNFSFNSIIAPYGTAYQKAIREKLAPESRGPFIIEVNPSLLALSPMRERSDVFSFPEDGGLLARMWFFDLDPNLEYVVRSRRTPFYRDPEKIILKLHPDGWLEIPPTPDPKPGQRKRIIAHSYEELFSTHILSRKRTAVLKEIIEELKSRGKVLLVRLPTSPEVAAIERRHFPDFSPVMNEMARAHGISFYDLYEAGEVTTRDGDHLTKESAEVITDLIGARIRAPQ